MSTNLKLIFILLLACPVLPAMAIEPDGQAIMKQVYGQHGQYPYIYEEQSMILVDKTGNRDVRNTRRYVRTDASGIINVLLVFDSPEEVKGVALLATQQNDASIQAGIYLPAFDERIISSEGKNSSDRFLGTDFTVFDLKPDRYGDFSYNRLEDEIIGENSFYQVEAVPLNDTIFKQSGYSKRIHTVSKDRFLVFKTRYFNRHGQHIKTLTQHEFKQYGASFWKPDMILMENLAEQHKTLLKTRERIFSPDYVPPKMFTRQWLFNHNHMASTVQHIFDNTLTPDEPVKATNE